MKNSDIEWIITNIVHSHLCQNDEDWYLFGSITKGCSTPSDIDLLIIYSNSESPLRIREEMADLFLVRPLHLIFMTTEEELETNFVAAQGCIQLYPNNLLSAI
jgi:predicted nucleotidyltransferase